MQNSRGLQVQFIMENLKNLKLYLLQWTNNVNINHVKFITFKLSLNIVLEILQMCTKMEAFSCQTKVMNYLF